MGSGVDGVERTFSLSFLGIKGKGKGTEMISQIRAAALYAPGVRTRGQRHV